MPCCALVNHPITRSNQRSHRSLSIFSILCWPKFTCLVITTLPFQETPNMHHCYLLWTASSRFQLTWLNCSYMLVKMMSVCVSVCVLVLTRVAQVWQAVANYCLSGKIFKWNALEPSILYEYNWNRHRMGCEALLAWKCLFTPTFFGGRLLTGKIGQIGLIFGVWSGFIRGLCSQDYKSLCAT